MQEVEAIKEKITGTEWAGSHSWINVFRHGLNLFCQF